MAMKKLVSVLLLLWGMQVDADPDSGFTDQGLASLQEMLDTAVQQHRIPAAIAMLALDGQVQWLTTAGQMEAGTPMRPDAILPLASVGKMFPATAAMILVERGRISLDDPVSRFVPEFAHAQVEDESTGETVAATTPMTIRHLLTHTGGLKVDGNAFWGVWDAHVGKTTTTTTTFARDLLKLHLTAQPGTRFAYGQTGASYEVLGAVIEIASGQTLEVFMTENIFQPLGLHDSYFYLPESKSHRLPAVYRMVDGALQIDRPAGEDFSRSTFLHGGGGVRTSPADVLRFARLFAEGGAVDGVRVLKPETVAMMTQDQLGSLAPDRWQARGRSWGFGASVTLAGSEHPDQYGWVGGGFARLWVDRKTGLIAYLNFPLTPPGDNDLLREFEERVYSALAGWGESPSNPPREIVSSP
jgi:CubicO group peptidase (beta-lactamase class C family)